MLLDKFIYSNVFGENSHDISLEIISNLNEEIIAEIEKKLQLTFVPEKKNGNLCFINNNDELQDAYKQTFAPIDVLDYIYAVSHSPTYREKYKEFLKIDFPRIPYPSNSETFWKLVKLGGKIRTIHLLEDPVLEKYLAQYPADGDNIVTKPKFIISQPKEFGAHNSPPSSTESLNSPPLKFGAHNSPPPEGCPKGGVVNSDITNQIPTIDPKDYFTINNIKIDHHKIIELPYNPRLKERAKQLRSAKNLSEVLFWTQVHKNKFHQIDFDRQRIIGNYIVDFYVKKLGLIVEIDGTSHDEKVEYDAKREDYLRSLDLKIFRIPVDDILNHLSTAMQDLEKFIIENYGACDVKNPLGPLGSPSEEKPHRPLEAGILPNGKPPRPLGTPPMEGNLGRVYINDTQYFDNVPEITWNFYIAGYQPAQKWLNDRKGRTLKFEDILHYQKMIVAFFEFDRLIKEIDTIEIV